MSSSGFPLAVGSHVMNDAMPAAHNSVVAAFAIQIGKCGDRSTCVRLFIYFGPGCFERRSRRYRLHRKPTLAACSRYTASAAREQRSGKTARRRYASAHGAAVQRRPGPPWSAPCSPWRGCLCIRSATAQTAPAPNRTVCLEAKGESRRASVRRSSFPDSHCDPILPLTQRSRTWATSFTSSARSSSSSHSCRSSGSASPSKRTPDGTPGHGAAARTGDRREFHIGRTRADPRSLRPLPLPRRCCCALVSGSAGDRTARGSAGASCDEAALGSVTVRTRSP